jgi:integral membrane protein
VDSRKIAHTAYRVMAYVTGVGLIVLTCVAMPIKYLPWFGHNSIPVAIVGAAHGFFYMAYVVCALVLAERCRWRPVRALLVLIAGTIPFVSFYAERKVNGWVRAMPPPKHRDKSKNNSVRGSERAPDEQSDLHA